jgi:hypothetical protein
MDSVQRAVPVGAAASPRWALRTATVAALIAAGPPLPQPFGRHMRGYNLCWSGDPRLALHGQPALRAASSARRNPRSAPAAISPAMDSVQRAVPVGAAASPRWALRTATVAALIAAGPPLPQPFGRHLRGYNLCWSGDPRLALHGQPALRVASSARRNPRSVPAAISPAMDSLQRAVPVGAAASPRWALRTATVAALIAAGPPLPQPFGRHLRGHNLCWSGDPRLALHGQPALRVASSARRNPRSAPAAISPAMDSVQRAVPVGAAASPRWALRTATVAALIAAGPPLPQPFGRHLRGYNLCWSGDPRLALHGQPALRVASSARRNPRSVPAAISPAMDSLQRAVPVGAAASPRWALRTATVAALIAAGPPLPQPFGRHLRGHNLCWSGDPRLALHGQPALRVASSARRNPRSAPAAISPAMDSVQRAVPVGAAASPRWALRTATVAALIAAGPPLPQPFGR